MDDDTGEEWRYCACLGCLMAARDHGQITDEDISAFAEADRALDIPPTRSPA